MCQPKVCGSVRRDRAHRPITWLLNFFCPGNERGREFRGETGLAGLTALKIPPVIERSATGACWIGISSDRRVRYSAKVMYRFINLIYAENAQFLLLG